MKTLYIQIGISIFAIILAITHIAKPDIPIDSITLAFIIIAIIPWFFPLIKSMEIPGGWKITFRDIENIKLQAEDAGFVLSNDEKNQKDKYSFELVADEDPTLALAGIRIELEKKLNSIAKKK